MCSHTSTAASLCVFAQSRPSAVAVASPLPRESLQSRVALCITTQEQTHQKPDPLAAPISVAIGGGAF